MSSPTKLQFKKVFQVFIFTVASLAGAAHAQQGGTLNLIVQPEPISLNPCVNRLGPATLVGNKIYDSLLGYAQKDVAPFPPLAQS